MKTKLKIACEPPVVKRASGYALIVGAILIAINHGDAIAAGDINSVRLLKMGLTIIVPYLVSTFSSVGAIQEFRGEACGDQNGG